MTPVNDDATHKSRTAKSFDALRDGIVEARYAPGEKLRIDHVSRELGVSSSAVREALSRLTAEGLVIAEPQRGFLVAPISRRDLVDLTEARTEVEGLCLARSIENGDLDWEGRVLSAHHKLRSLGNAYEDIGTPQARQWHRLHEDFHDELASACPNLWWLRLRRQLYTQSERYRRLSGPADETGRDIVGEHARITDAALARDANSAVRHMKDHLGKTTKILLKSGIPFGDDG